MPQSQSSKPPIPNRDGSNTKENSNPPYWTPEHNPSSQTRCDIPLPNTDRKQDVELPNFKSVQKPWNTKSTITRQTPSFSSSANSSHDSQNQSGNMAEKSRSMDSVRQSKLFSWFHPGIVVIVASIMLAVTGSVSLFTVDPYQTIYPGEYGDSVYSPEADSLEIGEPVTFKQNDDLVVTVPVTKTDPDIEYYGGYADVVVELADGSSYSSYIEILKMDFFTDQVYASTNIYYGSSDDIVDIHVDYHDNYGINKLNEYTWMMDDEYFEEDYSMTEPEISTLRKRLSRDQEFARYTIDITDDGVAEQNGMVIAKVTKPEVISPYYSDYSDDESVDGRCNIIFKKDGEVVFADVYDYPIATSKNGTFAFAYTAPYQLPEYDEVEIVDIR